MGQSLGFSEPVSLSVERKSQPLPPILVCNAQPEHGECRRQLLGLSRALQCNGCRQSICPGTELFPVGPASCSQEGFRGHGAADEQVCPRQPAPTPGQAFRNITDRASPSLGSGHGSRRSCYADSLTHHGSKNLCLQAPSRPRQSSPTLWSERPLITTLVLTGWPSVWRHQGQDDPWQCVDMSVALAPADAKFRIESCGTQMPFPSPGRFSESLSPADSSAQPRQEPWRKGLRSLWLRVGAVS